MNERANLAKKIVASHENIFEFSTSLLVGEDKLNVAEKHNDDTRSQKTALVEDLRNPRGNRLLELHQLSLRVRLRGQIRAGRLL